MFRSTISKWSHRSARPHGQATGENLGGSGRPVPTGTNSSMVGGTTSGAGDAMSTVGNCCLADQVVFLQSAVGGGK
ncbi:hypothetical protein EV126DRAFT_411067 [Verticillium dahliae]|nr:hypothetical protein EV126DRAFT_411067 [Verticillium dahliae]